MGLSFQHCQQKGGKTTEGNLRDMFECLGICSPELNISLRAARCFSHLTCICFVVLRKWIMILLGDWMDLLPLNWMNGGFVMAAMNFTFIVNVWRFVVTPFLKKKEIFIKCNSCALSFVSENSIRPLFLLVWMAQTLFELAEEKNSQYLKVV